MAIAFAYPMALCASYNVTAKAYIRKASMQLATKKYNECLATLSTAIKTDTGTETSWWGWARFIEVGGSGRMKHGRPRAV